MPDRHHCLYIPTNAASHLSVSARYSIHSWPAQRICTEYKRIYKSEVKAIRVALPKQLSVFLLRDQT